VRALVVALVTAAAVVTPVAARATPSARLVYVRDAGAEDCPDEKALRGAVAARLGYDPFFLHANATLFAEVTRQASTYRARVKLVDENGNVRGARELVHEGGVCADLVDAMALTMSIAIDPRSLSGPVVAEEPAREAPVTDETSATPAPAPPPPSPPSPPPAPPPARERETLHANAFVVANGWLGAAPAVALGVSPGIEARYGYAALAVAARIDARASASVPSGQVSTSFAAGSLAPCLAREWLRACAVVTVGRLAAGAAGIAVPREDAALHVVAGPRLGAFVPLVGRLSLVAQLDVMFAATPQILRIDGRDAYTLPTVSAGVGLGVAARLF